MKIMIISLTPFFGGGESFVLNLIRVIKNSKCRLEIFCRNEKLYQGLSNSKNIIVNRLKAPTNLMALVEMITILNNNKSKSNIIVLNGQLESFLSLPARMMGYKPIIVRHSLLSMTSNTKKLLFYFSCLFAKKIVCVSNTSKNEFPDFFLKKTELIYNWLDKSALSDTLNQHNNQSEFFTNNNLSIYYIGRVSKGKNVEQLILACNGLDNIDLNIVGDGDELDNLKNKYTNGVKFHGFISQENLYKHYELANLCVSCSSSETFGLSILEASYFSVPLLLSNIPAYYEITKNGELALIFEVGNVESLSNQLNKIVNNRELLADLSKKSFAIHKQFSSEAAKEKYLTLFKNVHES